MTTISPIAAAAIDPKSEQLTVARTLVRAAWGYDAGAN